MRGYATTIPRSPNHFACAPILVATLGVLIALVTASFARQQPADPPRMQLQGEVDLARLVDLCAQRLDLTVEYDASVLKGKVTLRLTESLTDAELWDLTNRVLGLRGFTTVRLRGADGR